MAIENLERPLTLTDVRSFFGLVEQVAYTFHSSEMMGPFRELLKPSNAKNGKVDWNNELEVAFQESKRAMIHAMEEGVRIYDKTCRLGFSRIGAKWE